MYDEVCPDRQEGRDHRQGVVISTLLFLLWWVPGAFAEQQGDFRANITFEHGYRFQGIDQGHGGGMLHASGQYDLTDNLSAGLWLGEYELPWNLGESKEIDYFLRYRNQLSFDRRIETSIWRYTYTDSYLDDYDWTQWLTSYHMDERFTVTMGLSHNFMGSDELTTFVEGTMRQSFGPWTAGMSIGGHNLSRTARESFEYIQFNVVYNAGNWHVFANYTLPGSIDDKVMSSFVHEGAGFGVSYTFSAAR